MSLKCAVQPSACPGTLAALVECRVEDSGRGIFSLCLDQLKAMMVVSERKLLEFYKLCVPETSVACCFIHVESNRYIIFIPKIQDCSSLSVCQVFILSVL